MTPREIFSQLQIILVLILGVVLTLEAEQSCTNSRKCSKMDKNMFTCDPRTNDKNELPDFQYVFKLRKIKETGEKYGVMCYDDQDCLLYCLTGRQAETIRVANDTCRNNSFSGISSLGWIKRISHVENSCFNSDEEWLWFVNSKDEGNRWVIKVKIASQHRFFDIQNNPAVIVPVLFIIYFLLIAAGLGIWRCISKKSEWNILQKNKQSVLNSRGSSNESVDIGIHFFTEDTGHTIQTSTTTFELGKNTPRPIPVAPPQVPINCEPDNTESVHDTPTDLSSTAEHISDEIPEILDKREGFSNWKCEKSRTEDRPVPLLPEKQRRSIFAEIRSIKIKPPVLPKPKVFGRFAQKPLPPKLNKPLTTRIDTETQIQTKEDLAHAVKPLQTKLQPPAIPDKPKGYSSLKRNEREFKKTSMDVFHEEFQEIRKKILAPGLTLHTRIQPNRISGTQTISTEAFFVEVIEEENDEILNRKSNDSSEDELDNQSLKSHHSYLDMKDFLHLKKTPASKADRCSKSSDDTSDSENEDKGDYEKMKKLCEYRKKGPPIKGTVDENSIYKRVGKIIKSGEQSKSSVIYDIPRVRSKIYCTPEPYKYEISKEDCKAMIENIRGSDPRREVIWNVRSKGKDYNYLTSVDCEDRSSDLGKSSKSDKDKPHIISVFFDTESRADSIGGCSDLARMSYVSALDGIYRTSTSYCASDGSVHYAYVYNGKEEDLHRVSSKLLTSGDLQNKEMNLLEQDISSSNLTLDSGLSVEMQHRKDTTQTAYPSRAVVQINICELASDPQDTKLYGERRSVLGSKFSNQSSSSSQYGVKTGQTYLTRTSLFFPGQHEHDISRQNVDRGSALYANVSQLFKR